MLKEVLLLAAFALLSHGLGYAGTATGMSGLFYTGENAGGGLLAGGSNDPHWSVGYASINGGASGNTIYEGAAYVINSSYLSGQGYVANTSTAQWITAPGASSATSGGTLNTGGNYLPGNGTGGNEGIYVYTLAFQITATGTGTITNNVQISITIAADDQFQVYVNPAGNGATIPTGTAAYTSGTSTWGNTSATILSNYNYLNKVHGVYTSGTNATFVVGTNYLTIVVDNTNQNNGNNLNASGLLFYQTNNAILIDGTPVPGTLPEVVAWLPIAGALGLFGWCFWRRGRDAGETLRAGF